MFAVQFQRIHESFPQAHEKMKGTSQKDDFALQFPALGKTCHGLIHNSLKDGGGNVFLPPALV